MTKYTIFPYQWYEEVEDDLSFVRVFGLTEDNESASLLLTNFKPYVYIELPTSVKWTTAKLKIVTDFLDQLIYKEQRPAETRFLWRKRLYYANLNPDGTYKKFPYLLLSFNSRKHIYGLQYKLKHPVRIPSFGLVHLKIHEQNAPSDLKICCLRDLKHASWFEFEGEEVTTERETRCKHEYIAKWSTLNPVANDTPARPLLMGMDIEVNSSNPKVFPVAKKPGDVVFQISCILQRQGDTKREEYLLTLGETDSTMPENVEVRFFKSEARLIEGYVDFIHEKDPQVIIGYNIFGFDIPYMIARSKLIMMLPVFDTQGCIIGKHSDETEISWSSAAMQNQKFEFIDAEGRLHVDLCPLVKRDYKLPNYRLETVATHFLGEHKDPLSPQGIFKCYRVGMTKDSEGNFTPRAKRAISLVGKYCVKDTVLVLELFEHLKAWYGLCEMANVCQVPIFKLYTQGQQIKVFSQIYKYAMHNEFVVEKDAFHVREDESYTGAHVFLPKPGLYEEVVPMDFCLTGDTLVSTSTGDNKRIDQLTTDTMVLGCKDGVLSNYSTVNGLQVKGERDIVKVWLKDGRTLRCTPDHKVMLADGTWCEAQHLRGKMVMDEGDRRVCSSALVVSVESAGREQVYDIEVEDVHNFVANGVVVSNCSLYPSLIIAYNLDYSTLVVDPSIPDEKCHIFNWEDHENCNHTDKYSASKKTICGERNYRFLKEPLGVLPTILKSLLEARKNTKREMAAVKGTNAALYSVLDKRQLSYKIACNSGYGATGVRKGYLPCMPIAMCTTYMGRVSLMKAAEYLQEKHEAHLVYGDSVVEDTPILCQLDGKVFYRTVDAISQGDWRSYHGDKEEATPLEGLLVWSDEGFTPIVRVIRHHTNKDIIRVLTHTGVVDVTEDHSLLDANAEKVTPNEVRVGQVLLSRDLPDIPEIDSGISCNMAFVWGLFYADGSCGTYHCPSGKKSSWALNNQNLLLLERCKDILNQEYNDIIFKILPTMESSSVYKLVPSGSSIIPFIRSFREIFYDSRKYKIVPDSILCSPINIRISFMNGYYAGDGDKDINVTRFDNKGKIGAAGLYHLTNSIGYNVSLNVRSDKLDIYRLTVTIHNQRKHPDKIKKLVKLPKTDRYVYDLETGNHHFGAGVGRLIVHNTDSTYVRFPEIKSSPELWDKCLEIEREMVAANVFPAPMKLAFEEVIYRKFFILTRKRYMSLASKRDGVIGSKIEKKGVLLARRDNAKFIRDIYADVMMRVFNQHPLEEVVSVVLDWLERAFSRSLPVDDFVITKSVKALHEYTVPALSTDPKKREKRLSDLGVTNENDYRLKALPAHAQLAERMKGRGTPVEAGTRMEFVMTDVGDLNARQFEKIEDIVYFKKHSEVLKLDFLYYLQLLSNPMDQVIGVAYHVECGCDCECNCGCRCRCAGRTIRRMCKKKCGKRCRCTARHTNQFCEMQVKYRTRKWKMLNELKRKFRTRIVLL